MKKKHSLDAFAFQPLPDEFIGSALRREAELFELSNGHHFSIAKAERSSAQLLSRVEISNSLDASVATETTLYPLFEALGLSGTVKQWAHSSSWKICVDCSIEDFVDFGVSYVHRFGAVKRVLVCPKHNRVLVSRCPFCGTLYCRHSVMRIHRCLGDALGPNESSKKYASAELEFSIFVQDLLNAQGYKAGEAVVRDAIYKALVEAGYLVTGLGSGRIHHEIDRERVYIDCSRLLPHGMKLHEWRNGRLEFESFLVLAFFAFRQARRLGEEVCRLKEAPCVDASFASFLGEGCDPIWN